MNDVEHHFIDKNVTEQKEKDYLLNAIDTIPCVQRKSELALQLCDRGNFSFAERCIVFTAVAGILFSIRS